MDFFTQCEFASFRDSLDAEMKRLQSSGLGSTHKQAEPLSREEEELLWEKNILGGHSPESLLKTRMVYILHCAVEASIGTCRIVPVKSNLSKSKVKEHICSIMKTSQRIIQVV